MEPQTFIAEENPANAAIASYVEKFELFFATPLYKKQLERLVGEYPEKRSVFVEFDDLEKFDPELAHELLQQPDLVLEAANQCVKAIDFPVLDLESFAPHVRVRNLPSDKQLLIRNIEAKHLNNLIAVEGIIRQFNQVQPKLKIAAWVCKRCKNMYHIEQEGFNPKKPSICECKARDFELSETKSIFENHQKIGIQESLEFLKGGEQATTLDIHVTDDLVNKVTPGDKTTITGVLRLYPPKDGKSVFGRYLEAISLEEKQKEFLDVEITKEEEEEIRKLAKDPSIYVKLIQSVAPSIYGHESVKEAITLQLFSGVKKTLPGKITVRGNIHILLMGDPGVAKSQLLRQVDLIAPKSIYVAGKTTSGVGLCVAPGTLILNDRGFKPIEQFVEEQFDEKIAKEEIKGAFSNSLTGKNADSLGIDLKVGSKPIEKIWRIQAPAKMIHVATRSGKKLQLTPNTSLIRIKNGKIEWAKASELAEGDFVATARAIPSGQTIIYCAELLKKNKTTRIANNVAKMVTKITDRLCEAHQTDLKGLAKIVGIQRARFDRWRSVKWYQAMPLHLFWEWGRKTNFSPSELASSITELEVRYGKRFKIPTQLNDAELFYLAGLAMGDGNLYETKNSASVRIWGSDPQTLKEIDRITKEKFNLTAEKIVDRNGLKGRRIKFKEIVEFLKELGFSKKPKLQISHSATEMPSELLAHLLSGLFDTDGYASQSKTGSSHIGIGTISEKLAQTIQLSLLKFGIQSRLRKRKKAGQVALYRGESITSRFDQYYVEVRGKNNLEQFNEKIGFKLNRKRKALESIISSIGEENTNIDVIPEIKSITGQSFNVSRKKLSEICKQKPELAFLAHSDVYWDEIKERNEFEPTYQWVYDFTVRENHNFIANGFFVHNTASAEKDEFGEGGWTLKAGALVLASGGMVMIDEFDKIDEEDRSALHEAMEQGMISVAKAGIVTTFKTDTSLLAAANPKYSRFDVNEPFLQQIELPPTLISRFDLMFPIRDVLDRKKDETVSGFILARHRQGERDVTAGHRPATAQDKADQKVEEAKIVIAHDLLRKYVSFARQRIFPIMTDEAMKSIQEFYLTLRDLGRKDNLYTITLRQLEALVRLSEASARIRLSETVEESDTERAIRIFRYSLQEMALDKETGKIDIDIITTGQAHSKISHLKKILQIIRDLSEDGKINANLDDVLRECQNNNIELEKAQEFISELKKKGEIYEPKYGNLKPADKRMDQ